MKDMIAHITLLPALGYRPHTGCGRDHGAPEPPSPWGPQNCNRMMRLMPGSMKPIGRSVSEVLMMLAKCFINFYRH